MRTAEKGVQNINYFFIMFLFEPLGLFALIFLFLILQATEK